MPIVFKIDFKNLKKNALNSTKRIVQETTNNVYSDVRKFSPIDTGLYVSSHRNRGVQVQKDRIIGIVENTGEYSERIEKGFRKTAVNWHLRNLGQIYFSRGAEVYGKAVAKNKDIFIKKLRGL